MNRKPKISVIIPTFNRPELLKRSIKSVLNQSFQNFEIIVVDDGLEKRADKIIEKINDDRIVYIKHRKNKGVSVSRNNGVEISKGEFITFLDDDDEYYPEKLKRQYNIMEKHLDQIDFTFCLAETYFKEKGVLISSQKNNFKEGVHYFFEEALSMNIPNIIPTIFCKKEKILQINNFDKNFPSAEDKDFMISLSKISHGFFLNEVLVKVNSSEKESDHLSGNLQFRIQGRELLLKKYNTDLNKRPKILAKHLSLLAFLYQENNNYEKASKLFLNSWKLNKTDFRFLKWFSKSLFLRFFNKAFKEKSN